VKAALKKSQHYRTGDLVQVDGDWVEVQFGAAGCEVVPISCVSVLARNSHHENYIAKAA
jgi:hypothetical protein